MLSDDVKKLYNLIDLVLLDIKHMDRIRHKKITGLGNETALETARFLEQKNKKFWVRFE